VTSPKRLLSLDTLRGFDMFWIIGGDMLFRTLGEITNYRWAKWWSIQMEHAEWDGFHAYDLVFPLFMFIAGVAVSITLTNKLLYGVSKTSLYKKSIKRAIILIILGFLYNGLLNLEFLSFRFASVLGQIGLAYLITVIIYMNTKRFRIRILWFFGILLVYAFIQLLVPVPGCGTGMLSPECSINSFIDRLLLPGALYGKIYDPEGILCIVSASGITLLGAVAGDILQSDEFTNYRKVLILSVTGLVFIIAASGIHIFYPVIKSLWTSTFNLLTGGFSLLLLAIFYLIVDVWKLQGWSFFFRVIGLNSITIYMATVMVNFSATSDFLFGGLAGFCGKYEPIVLIIGLICIEWLFLLFLYKKKIFLKV